MTRFLSDYVNRLGIALSVLLNVVLGGYSNQTFSARNYEWRREGYPNIVWLIDFFEVDHCMIRWVNWKIIEKALKEHGI